MFLTDAGAKSVKYFGNSGRLVKQIVVSFVQLIFGFLCCLSLSVLSPLLSNQVYTFRPNSLFLEKHRHCRV